MCACMSERKREKERGRKKCMGFNVTVYSEGLQFSAAQCVYALRGGPALLRSLLIAWQWMDRSQPPSACPVWLICGARTTHQTVAKTVYLNQSWQTPSIFICPWMRMKGLEKNNNIWKPYGVFSHKLLYHAFHSLTTTQRDGRLAGFLFHEDVFRTYERIVTTF